MNKGTVVIDDEDDSHAVDVMGLIDDSPSSSSDGISGDKESPPPPTAVVTKPSLKKGARQKRGAKLFHDAVANPGVINWSSDQKDDINTVIARGRLKERQRQMRLQRGGRSRYAAKQQMALAAGKKPRDPLVAAKKQNGAKTQNEEVQRKIKEGQKRRQQEAKALEERTVFEVPGTGTEYDTVRLNLVEDEPPASTENDNDE